MRLNKGCANAIMKKKMARIKLKSDKLEHERKLYLAKQHNKVLKAKLPTDLHNS